MRTLDYRRPAIWVLAISLSLGFWLNAAPLLAHGVSWSLSSQKVYGFEFTFDDGTPMSFAEIKVFSPGDAETLSQTGRTDKNGYFAFIPDADGKWTVRAADGTGHLARAQIEVKRLEEAGAGTVAAEAAAFETRRAVEQALKPWKIALVISVFINLAAIAAFFRRKKA